VSAPQARPRLVETDAARFEHDALRREIDRLRAFVEMRAQAQESLTRAMLAESTARAAEALESRIQLAAREAMAFAEQGLERHEATLRAFGGRLAEIARDARAPAEAPLAAPAATAAYRIGASAGQAQDGQPLDIRDDSEDAFLADLGNLAILPGGAAKLVAAHVVEYVPAAALAQKILPHWRSRLAPGGELVVVTLDGPAWTADLVRGGDFASLRRRLSAEGAARPPRNLFDAPELAEVLRAAGLTPLPPATSALELKIVARAPSA
jgi:SAM-dependent methyltransferase